MKEKEIKEKRSKKIIKDWEIEFDKWIDSTNPIESWNDNISIEEIKSFIRHFFEGKL